MARWQFPSPHYARRTLICAVGSLSRQIAETDGALLDGVPGADRIRVRCIDADVTANEPHKPLPLVPPASGPLVEDDGRRIEMQQPRPELVESIRRGERRGAFDTVPFATLEALQSAEAAGVGGRRSGGKAVVLVNREVIRARVRADLMAFMADGPIDGGAAAQPINVVILCGIAGGMSGALVKVLDIIQREAERLHLPIRLYLIIVVPGTNPIPDEANAKASAAAFIAEIAARATGRYETLDYEGNGAPRRRRRWRMPPVLVLSDTSNAPGQPGLIATKALVAEIAHFVFLLTSTELGDRLQANLQDFDPHAYEVTVHGECRIARAAGFTFVTLDRTRVALFATARLAVAALTRLRGPTPARDPDPDVRTLAGGHRLLQGDERNDLAASLRGLRADGSVGDDQAARFRNLFHQNRGTLHGRELLEHGRDIFDTTKRQTLREAQTRMQAAARGVVQRVVKECDRRINDALRSPREGVTYAKAYVEALGAFATRATELASTKLRNDRARLDAAAVGLDAIVEKALPDFLAMNWLRQKINADKVEDLAEQFVQSALSVGAQAVDDLAQQTALVVFDGIQTAVEERRRILIELEAAVDAATAEFTAEQERIRGWDGLLTSPKGLRLDADLDGMYGRVLAPPDAEAPDVAALEAEHGDAVLALLRREGLLTLARDEGGIATAIDTIVAARLRPAVEQLHVQDEFLRRFPPGTEALRQQLRALDADAFEAVRLSALADADDPPHFLRYWIGDAHRQAEIIPALNHVARTRGVQNIHYQLVATGERERFVLMQVRFSLPLTRMVDHREWREHLDHRASASRGPLHTDLVGAFLPEPGVAATPTDAETALVEAVGSGAIELEHGHLVFHDLDGVTRTVDPALDTLRPYALRVETITRLYTLWREKGSDAVRQRLREIAAEKAAGGGPNGTVASHVAPLVSDDALARVERQLAHYESSVPPAATLWG